MFLLVITIPLYALAVWAMCCMETILKAFMFLCLLLATTFLLYLFINYPFPSALGVIALSGVLAIKI